MRRLDELGDGGGQHLGRAALVLLLSVTLLAAAAVGAHRVGLIDSWLDAGPDRRSAPAPPDLRLPAPRPAHPVLSRLGSAPAPQARRLRAVIADALADPSLGPHVGVAVEDLTHGRPVLRVGGQRPFVPASLNKLFTVAAALRVLRPDQRFETSIVRVPGTHRIVLVGGGDPLLARRAGRSGKPAVGYPPQASLAMLAARAAKAMRHLGVHRVKLQLDASLFAGPAVNRHWLSTYVRDEVVSPIRALWVDEGRVAPDDAARSSDPVRAAGRTFAGLLSRHGIQVIGAIRQRPAPRRAVEIAAVRSPPLVEVIDEVLGLSDNEAAEVLLRQVALARGFHLRSPAASGRCGGCFTAWVWTCAVCGSTTAVGWRRTTPCRCLRWLTCLGRQPAHATRNFAHCWSICRSRASQGPSATGSPTGAPQPVAAWSGRRPPP